jgi:hypothetical protein
VRDVGITQEEQDVIDAAWDVCTHFRETDFPQNELISALFATINAYNASRRANSDTDEELLKEAREIVVIDDTDTVNVMEWRRIVQELADALVREQIVTKTAIAVYRAAKNPHYPGTLPTTALYSAVSQYLGEPDPYDPPSSTPQRCPVSPVVAVGRGDSGPRCQPSA